MDSLSIEADPETEAVEPFKFDEMENLSECRLNQPIQQEEPGDSFLS